MLLPRRKSTGGLTVSTQAGTCLLLRRDGHVVAAVMYGNTSYSCYCSQATTRTTNKNNATTKGIVVLDNNNNAGSILASNDHNDHAGSSRTTVRICGLDGLA